MTTRYFEIRSPRADFTGRVGAISFADGVARVSFEDDREGGVSLADEHRVQTGRSAVLFARRRPGYVVTEVDAQGQPLKAAAADEAGKQADDGKPSRSASKADWKAYATSPEIGMAEADAEAMTRDQLAEKFLGPKGA